MLPDLNEDFQDLIKSLTEQSVDFLIVGAHALAFHGIARFTQDLDLWMRRSEENVEKLRRALADFGVPISDADIRQMLLERKFLRFGHEPRRVEIPNFLDGCEYDQAAARACHENLGGASVAILGLMDYVATKRAADRKTSAILNSFVR